nr:DUF4129 domain-containing protein [Paenibacillus curdlanolyticus]
MLRAIFISMLLLPAVIALALYAVPTDERLQWILTVPFVFAAGELLARLFAGRRRWLLEVIAVLLALSYVYLVYGTSKVSFLSDLVFVGIIIFGTFRPRDGAVWSAPLVLYIISFLMYALVSFILQEEPNVSFYSRLLNVSGAVTLVVSLFLFNKNAVRRESYADRNGGGGVSQSILWHNRLLVTIIGGLILIVSFLSDISAWLRRLLSQILNQLKEWLNRAPYVDKPGPISNSQEQVLSSLDSGKPSHWIEMLGQVAIYFFTALIIAAAIWTLYRVIRKLPFVVRMLERWMQRIMGKERMAAAQAGYVDETEEINHTPLSDRFKRFASGLRPTRHADEWDRLPDNAARIRYLYRTALLAREQEGYHPKPHLTPRETAHELKSADASIRDLPEIVVTLYERARYGGASIKDSEAEEARLIEVSTKKKRS